MNNMNNMSNMNPVMMNMMMQMMMNNNNNMGNNMNMGNMQMGNMGGNIDQNMMMQMMNNNNNMGNNMNMGNMQMNNMGMNNSQIEKNNNEEWSLNFKKKNGGEKLTIYINPEKLVREAISKYKTESSDNNPSKFIFNKKELCQTSKISESGLKNGSEILVEDLEIKKPEIINLIFTQKNQDNKVNVTVNRDDLVSDAIQKYRNKTNDNNPCKFINNASELDPTKKLAEAGLKQNSKILVISLANLEGA